MDESNPSVHAESPAVAPSSVSQDDPVLEQSPHAEQFPYEGVTSTADFVKLNGFVALCALVIIAVSY